MGTDIHSVLQVKRDGVWVSFALGYNDRNYHVFGMLADVRNGSRSDGEKAGDEYEPISTPRGLPADFVVDEDCVHTPPENFRWEGYEWLDNPQFDYTKWMGDHSYSWVTLAELLAVDFTKTTGAIGVLVAEDYLRYRAQEYPYGAELTYEHFCYVTGDNTVTISVSEFEQLGGDLTIYSGKKVYIWIRYLITYASGFRIEYFSWLVSACKDAFDFGVTPSEIRMVFGFDN
ncbi:MAG: hypothetical protein ABJA67_04110 [Chthonomonadales bacterium]